MSGMQSGHQRSPARCANACSAVGLGVTRSLARNAVEIRCLDQLLSVTAHITHRQIIAQDKNDVGFRWRFLGKSLAAKRTEQRKEENTFHEFNFIREQFSK